MEEEGDRAMENGVESDREECVSHTEFIQPTNTDRLSAPLKVCLYQLIYYKSRILCILIESCTQQPITYLIDQGLFLHLQSIFLKTTQICLCFLKMK